MTESSDGVILVFLSLVSNSFRLVHMALKAFGIKAVSQLIIIIDIEVCSLSIVLSAYPSSNCDVSLGIYEAANYASADIAIKSLSYLLSID